MNKNNSIEIRELVDEFNPKYIEKSIRKNWNNNNLKVDGSKKKRMTFIEGPPTMNGEPHIGHIRGRIIKDLWYRFSTLKGFNVLFRGGWDTQGLPVELQAEKELGLTGSKIDNMKAIGEEKLVETCKKIVLKYNKIWVETDKQLGMSLNYDQAYWTMRDEYIEREWKYLETAWKTGLLGEGYRAVAYCPSCQTSLSHTEVALGYKKLTDPSLYYKMKLKNRDEFIILWTTMPFTIITDELVGVQPDAEYLHIKINSEIWIIGSERAKSLLSELEIDEYEIIKKIKGKELEGEQYEYPLNDIESQMILDKNKIVHSIVAEDFVDITTGTGLVHMSPANGEIDLEIANKRKIPIFNPIDDQAKFTKEAGKYQGIFVRDSDEKVIEEIKKKGLLVKSGKISHDYPTCWRSNHRLIWMARREYFYWVNKLGNKAIKAAENTEYFFNSPRNRFLEIVKEKVPWNITRERIWGAPLPIWSCVKCNNKTVAFSRKEIIRKAINLPDGENFELHRPWIDRIVLKCDKCNNKSYREPFVLDTWHNSGAAPLASLTDEEFNKYTPATFLTEGIDQTRGWAYSLLIENVLLKNKAESPFRAFLFQGHVLDEKGEKMSKSKGNIVDAASTLKRESIDILRFYLIWKASPIDPLNFSINEMKTRPYQVLSTLYHLHIFYKLNSSYDKFDINKYTIRWLIENKLYKIQDKWILSKIQHLIEDVTRSYNSCKYNEGLKSIENFLIEYLSQKYIPMTRNTLWDDSGETLNERLAIYSTLAYILKILNKLLHPVTPHITEYLYQTCFGKTDNKSILVGDWPESNIDIKDKEIENDFEIIEKVVSLCNSARMKANLKRRWPLNQVLIFSNKNLSRIIKHKDILSEQSNINNIICKDQLEDLPTTCKLRINIKDLGSILKHKLRDFIVKVENKNANELYKKLLSEDKVIIKYDGKNITLTRNEMRFEFISNEKYQIVEKDGIVIALDKNRDEKLILNGYIRDLARRLQSLRKEKNFNPTEIKNCAYIVGIEDKLIEHLKHEEKKILHLVRVKEIKFLDTCSENIEWSDIELNGKQISISID